MFHVIFSILPAYVNVVFLYFLYVISLYLTLFSYYWYRFRAKKFYPWMLNIIFQMFCFLTHVFPMHRFSTTLKTSENSTVFRKFSGCKERVNWKQMLFLYTLPFFLITNIDLGQKIVILECWRLKMSLIAQVFLKLLTLKDVLT